MPKLGRTVLCAAVLLLGTSAAAQKPTRIDAVCQAISSWTHDFHRRALQLDQSVQVREPGGFGYLRIGLEHRLFGKLKGRSTTHLATLLAMIAVAERHPGERVAGVLLRLAASGYDHELYRREMLLVRDAGHAALLRMDEPAVWQFMEREAKRTGPHTLVLRIAAVRLLGLKRRPAARATVEAALRADEARVRLTAAEALPHFRDRASLPILARAIETERHPIVALALLDAADRVLRRLDKLLEADWAPVVDARLRTLGRAGWRNDLATVRFVRRYPRRNAVPTLISLLEPARPEAEDDPMLKLVRRDASPLLAHEAWWSLRRITGAVLPQSAPRWREFWAKEKDRVQLTAAADDATAKAATRAQGGFFGIPVCGRDVFFVIDTSHSMRDEVTRQPPTGKGAKIVQRMRHRKDAHWTRLDAAKEQVLTAIAEMDPGSHFRIVTFATKVRAWQKKPVPARRRSLRKLMKTLDRVRPEGFTNTHAALAHVLDTAGALDAKAADRVDEVFLLSDGEPSEGALQDIDKILARVKKLNTLRQIRINTVFTGTGEGATFMRKLAAQNHGVFVHYGQ